MVQISHAVGGAHLHQLRRTGRLRQRHAEFARAWTQGISPRASLDNNDGHGYFQALGDSVVTGPTLTNVNDTSTTFAPSSSMDPFKGLFP